MHAGLEAELEEEFQEKAAPIMDKLKARRRTDGAYYAVKLFQHDSQFEHALSWMRVSTALRCRPNRLPSASC
jgi:hypothetical protein